MGDISVLCFVCSEIYRVKLKFSFSNLQFTIAVVMMALAISAQAAIVPLAYSLPYGAPYAAYQYSPYQYNPLAYTAQSLPLTYAAAPAIQYEYAPAIRSYPGAPAFAELRSPATIIPVAAEG